MEMWRQADAPEERPKVLCVRSMALAIALHAAMFVAFWLYSACHDLFKKKETIIPIDLSIVVNENLNGKENEPPPLVKPPEKKPEPPPEKKPEPNPGSKPVDKPKELEQMVTNTVVKADKTKPEPPKKTKEQERQERIAQMIASAKPSKTKVDIEVRNRPSGDGRTERRTQTPEEIRRLLGMGVRPGTTNQLPESEEQLYLSLIRQAFEDKWDQPPWTDTLRPMIITCKFGPGGKLVGYKLTQSSGDSKADQTILRAAALVGAIPGMSDAFIRKYRDGLPVRFTVKPQ